MISLRYGKYVNGSEQILAEKDFRPIKVEKYKIVETNDFRDLRGELIRTVLYEKNIFEITIGFDEYLKEKNFLENFFAANLTKIVIDGIEYLCKNAEKGKMSENEQERKKVLKLKLEVE